MQHIREKKNLKSSLNYIYIHYSKLYFEPRKRQN